jgi:hypothetical protein
MQIATCPHCQQRIEADDSFAGTDARCPSCGGNVFIPQLGRKAKNSLPIKMKQNKNTILSVSALVVALVAILMQLGVFPRSSLDFTTPEDAIKSFAKVNQSGTFMDYRRMNKLFRDDSDWESIPPKKIVIAKNLEVKDTGDSDYDGGVLCFLKFKKSDGVDSHKVVFLQKTKNGLFQNKYLGSPITKEYGSVIESWEKNGTLK